MHTLGTAHTGQTIPTPDMGVATELLPGFEPEQLVHSVASYRLRLLRYTTATMAQNMGEPTNQTERDQMPPPEVGDGLPPLLDAHNLLVLAGKPALREQLVDPANGGWLTYMTKNLELPPDDADPLLNHHAHFFHNVAAAAAIRSGGLFTHAVPTWGGRAMLPGLGQVTLHEVGPDEDRQGVAAIVADADTITITEGERTVILPRDDLGTDTEGWTALKTVEVPLQDGTLMHATLDHLHPFRRQAQTIPPNNDPLRLDPQAEQDWLDHLRGGMELLARDHPALSAMVSKIMCSVVPLSRSKPEIPTRPLSASAGSTIGSTEMNWQGNGGPANTTVAATLVHEIAGHNRLNLEMVRARLTSTAHEKVESMYAPWRDDVRHAFGLLHGIVSFMEVANFWRDRVTVETEGSPERRLAEFETAHWREQLHSAMVQFTNQPELLTEAGQHFMQTTVVPTIGELMNAPLASQALEEAAQTVAYNRARWVAHHLAPNPSTTTELAASWQNGDAEPRTTLDTKPALSPDPNARDLDIWAHMNRVLITEPDQLTAGYIPGSSDADVAFLSGDTAKAQRLFLETLVAPESYDQASAIVGYGFALAASGDPRHQQAAHLLMRRPDIYRDVQRQITSETGSPADPMQLAEWLSGLDRPADEITLGSTAVKAILSVTGIPRQS